MLQIFDCEQGSDEWHKLHCGIPTSSHFKDILAEGEGRMRTGYLRRKAAERFSGQTGRGYSDDRMTDGHRQEPLIRNAYAFFTNAVLRKVGFVRNDVAGASTDWFIEPDGILEVKSADPHILLGFIERDKFPSEHWAQCQGGLWVCDRYFVDIAIGCFPEPPPPKPYPVFIKRAYRDERYIAELAQKVRQFSIEIEAGAARFESYVPKGLSR